MSFDFFDIFSSNPDDFEEPLDPDEKPMTEAEKKNALAELHKAVLPDLAKSVEHLRKEKNEFVFVFNKSGRTVCVTTDMQQAALVAHREGLSLEDAATAEPI